MRRIHFLATAAIAAVAILIWSGPANAYPNGYSPRAIGWGPVLGVTANPDQVHFGVQMDLGEIAPRLSFQPNFEVGVGDNETMGALGAAAEYHFESGAAWAPYLGGGMGVNFVGHDNRSGLNESSDMTGGLTLIGGLERAVSGGNRLFIESRVGLIDAPDLELSLGWTFYH